MGNHHEACACYNKVLEMAPGNFKAWYNRGKSRLAQNLPEEAANDFDKATSLKPKNANAHEKFGDALSLCGKEEEAALQWAIAEQLRKKKKNTNKD
jgi:tetratricopeptide (TPR) repeat protein